MNLAIRLNAGNTRQGNPRRIYVVLSPHGIIDVINEGHNGDEELRRLCRISATADFDTTPAEYRRLRKRYEASRGLGARPRRRR